MPGSHEQRPVITLILKREQRRHTPATWVAPVRHLSIAQLQEISSCEFLLWYSSSYIRQLLISCMHGNKSYHHYITSWSTNSLAAAISAAPFCFWGTRFHNNCRHSLIWCKCILGSTQHSICMNTCSTSTYAHLLLYSSCIKMVDDTYVCLRA